MPRFWKGREMKTREVEYKGERGYLAQPDGGSKSGVLLLTTIYGVNKHIRHYAHMLADAGHTALIWNYDGQPGIDDVSDHKSAIDRARKLNDTAVGRMSVLVTYMLEEMKLKAVGTAGFCLGGRYCLLLAAADRRLAACVSYHPSINDPPHPGQTENVYAACAKIPSPVLMIYPGKDHVTSRAAFDRMQEALQSREAPTVTHLLPDADHGFLHRPSPQNDAAGAFTTPQAMAFFKAALG